MATRPFQGLLLLLINELLMNKEQKVPSPGVGSVHRLRAEDVVCRLFALTISSFGHGFGTCLALFVSLTSSHHPYTLLMSTVMRGSMIEYFVFTLGFMCGSMVADDVQQRGSFDPHDTRGMAILDQSFQTHLNEEFPVLV